MDRLENSLSVEQEFSHRAFSDRVKQLSREEAQDLHGTDAQADNNKGKSLLTMISEVLHLWR